MNKKLLLMSSVFGMAIFGSLPANAIDKDGDVYKITSNADWVAFAKLVNDGTEKSASAKLMNDITVAAVTNYVGSNNLVGTGTNKYAGTFDGQGYTITFTEKTGLSDGSIAPFRVIESATIKNLRTAGSLGTSNTTMGGIVGQASGVCTITNCSSSMSLSSTNSTNDATIGGIIGLIDNGATVNINYCEFTGTLSATRGVSGIIGYIRNTTAPTVNVKGVLYRGTAPTSGNNMYTFYRGGGTATLTNCYRVSMVGSSTQGTEATTENLLNGSIAYKLNIDNTETLFWGQGGVNNSTVEAYPTLTTDKSKKVYEIEMNNASTRAYGNAGGAVPNPVRYGWLGVSTESDNNKRTPLVTLPSNYSGGKLYAIYDKYCLNVTKAGATTLILPFDANLPENVKAYKLNYTSGDKVTAESVDKIKANEPVLINAPEGTYTLTVENSSTITWSSTTTSGALTGVYVQSGKSGNYNPIAYVPANSYVLQNGKQGIGFYKVATANTIRITSFRAYLTPEATSGAPEHLSITFDEGETTGIASVRENRQADDAIYTLSGIRVDQPTKGIYVKNGRKFVVK